MRKILAATMLAMTASALAIVPTTAAVAAAPTATITWPTGTVGVNDNAKVTVKGSNLNGATKVYLFDAKNYPDGVFRDMKYIEPTNATVSLALPTGSAGTKDYVVLVGMPKPSKAFVNDSAYTLTVKGVVTKVTANFPTGPLRAQAAATVTGTVNGPVGRTVQIQSRGQNGSWVTLAETRSTTGGKWSVPAPTWWVAKQTLRAYAPGTASTGPDATDTTSDLSVTRTYTPRRGNAFNRAGDEAGSRWNPCQVITYRVNRNRMPSGGLKDVKAGFKKVSEATGLRFKYLGTTTFVPLSRKNAAGATIKNASIAVAWSTPTTVRGLRTHNGLGGFKKTSTSDPESRIVKGYVVLRAGKRLASTATANRTAWKKVALHQMGHTVGLGNVSDSRQIMNETSKNTPTFGAGDLLGLAEVGAAKGCH